MIKKLILKKGTYRYWLEIPNIGEVSGTSIMVKTSEQGEIKVRQYFYMRDVHPNWSIELLHAALDPIQTLEVEKDILINKDRVYIWSLAFFKREARLDFKTTEESFAHFLEYGKYYDKRWDEMSSIELTIADWNALEKQWKRIKKDRPQYVIFELDDTVIPNKVTLSTKDVLTEEDKRFMLEEHELYMKYELARQEYHATLDDYSPEWRGPQDDEYHTDIMKFYKK